MEEMPEEIFCDAACMLSEYCLNREPKLFKNTRFWHDLCHSIEHNDINSEICEQVNVYLQYIKYTASHLSQEHFVFFVQFFLYLLNKEKPQSFEKLASIALASQF